MTDNDQDNILRLKNLRENPLFGEKPTQSVAPPDEAIETLSKPTNLSQHIYDKLYPYFTDILQKAATAEKPLLLDADFYVKLAEAIRVQNWNDTCSIKLWILINSIKSPLAKNTGNKWADLYKTANDIYKKVRSERRKEDEINSFTCPRGQWIDYDTKTKPRPTVENCIVALRFILEDDKITLKYDLWKRTVVIVWPPRPTTSDIYDPLPENTDVMIKEWQNRIHVEHNITFSDEVMRIARFRIAVKNQIHSQKDYYKSLKWDSVSRIALLATEIFKLQGTALELEVLRMQLIASVRRVLMPGTKYDLVPCLISKQGVMKSFGLSVLYRTHNVLDEDILDLNSQKQSEKMRNGKNCLELPDSFGRNADYDTIKAFVSRRHDHGRDAYGRVEDIKDVGRTYVIWHTGNNPKLFRDPTGNRRFIPMPISGEIDEKLLRQLRDQIWAEAVELEKVGRLAYYEKMRQEGIPVEEGDEKFPDIMLDPKFYNDAALLQSDARVENEYQEMVADVIFQSFVHFEQKRDRATAYVLSEDIRLHLGISPGQWNKASQKISEAMQDIAVISRSEYAEWAKKRIETNTLAAEKYPDAITSDQKKEHEWFEAHQELSQDIKWIKPPKGIKRNGQPLNGYRIDFEPTHKTKEFWIRDYEILPKFIAMHNSSDTVKILRKDRPL
jgi:predicted P-loop ATPase